MPLRPPSAKPSASSSEITSEDLQIARTLEQQILDGQDMQRVETLIREIVEPYVGKPLTEVAVLEAQRELETALKRLSPPWPRPGVKFKLKPHPDDAFSLILELEDEQPHR